MTPADADAAVTDILDEHHDNDTPLTRHYVASLLRAAYGRGYTDALAAAAPNMEQAYVSAEQLRLRVPVV